MADEEWGLIVYAGGCFDVAWNGWRGEPHRCGSYRQLQTDAVSAVAGRDQLAAATATRLATIPPEAEADLDRLDVVWWCSGPSVPLDTEIIELLATARAEVEHAIPTITPDDPWPFVPNWHQVAGNDKVRFTCTVESRANLRLWFIAATAPYNDPAGAMKSISNILEREDHTDERGALAEYAAQLASARQHTRASLDTDNELPDSIHTDSEISAGVLLALAEASSEQRTTHHALFTTRFNIDRATVGLSSRLDDLAGDKLDWPHHQDKRQADEAVATLDYWAHRAEALHQQAQAIRAHQASVEATLATRSNSYATLLLTMGAGALTAAQLSNDTHTQIGLALAASGLLLAIGLAVIDATVRTTWAHVIVTTLALAAAALGAGVARDHKPVVLATLAAAGTAIGLACAVAFDRLKSSGRYRHLRELLGRPLQP